MANSGTGEESNTDDQPQDIEQESILQEDSDEQSAVLQLMRITDFRYVFLANMMLFMAFQMR
ncbi:MAG TPA: hypothetical protein DGB32_03425, partial [Dehalococcoidia bacterium]|nr:hypothetical protein [Dehalococcoidia bacterium]